MRLSLLALGVLATTLLAQQPTENCAVAVLTPPAGFAINCPQNVAQDPTVMLDLTAANGYLSLCGGDLVEVQLGVTVIDGPGPDLQVDEVNSNVTEPYRVELSPDGVSWFPAPGPYANGAWGGDSAIDIAGLGLATVNFVRITDLSLLTVGNTPGPDFDSIVCINYMPPWFGGAPRAYADSLVSYNQGVTTSSVLTDGTRALGMPDAYRSEVYSGTAWVGAWNNAVSMGAGASVVVFFSQNYIADGPGGDVIVHEYYSAEGQFLTVLGSDDGTNWVPLVPLGSVSSTYGNGALQTTNVQSFDLAGTGLPQADYIRIDSTSTVSTGATPGAELDAIEGVNFIPKVRRLTEATPLMAGGVGALELNVIPSHIGDIAVTVPSVGAPLPLGGGLSVGPGVELRLPFFDPVLQFVLYDPAGPLIVSGVFSPVGASGMTGVTVTLPPDPSLPGLILYWQSVLFPAVGGATGASNLLVTTVQ